VFNIHFNSQQKKELSKAFFNFGNIVGGALIVSQAIFGLLTLGSFIFGLFCFTIIFAAATLLLSEERNRL